MPEHAGSRVRFDGQYGAAGHHRQYYKCVPANGDGSHRSTEILPREESWNDVCEVCECDVELHEGPHAARKYQFVARGVAEALVAGGAARPTGRRPGWRASGRGGCVPIRELASCASRGMGRW